MEHFITGIQIKKVRHLQNINIELTPDSRMHLILTGKNGSGKTSLLLAIKQYLTAINDNSLNDMISHYSLPQYTDVPSYYDKYKSGIELSFSEQNELDTLYAQGNFITAYFPANRQSEIMRVHGVENVHLATRYSLSSEPAKLLLKYMVHLKTQQAYAANENDIEVVERIKQWFLRFENALKGLLDDHSITLQYDYLNYDFKIHQQGREAFSFDEVSDGYSALIRIVADLILRMDKNWLQEGRLSEYNSEGIVLIDELETHLHTELQRKILPFLTEFFPRLQFIVSTHSPYILNSIENACVYDLEKQIQFTNLSNYSAEDIAEGYFDTEAYSEKLQNKVERYRTLTLLHSPTDEERAERARLRMELKKIPGTFAPKIHEEFAALEKRRKEHGQI